MPNKCEQDGCKKRPIFDISGGKGRFCINHKTIYMKDVKSKQCEYEGGCDSVNPQFDYIGGRGRFCNIHKSLEMMNVRPKPGEYDKSDSINPRWL